ncbi:MAG: gamma-glutamyltransferase [Alphaproteobacteria bacterium]
MAVLTLSACGGKGPETGDLGYVEGFLGGVMADEPRAALVGRDTLSAGGSAVDAVVAAYFTMAVTLPGTAGLGGGGVCLVVEPSAERADAFEFLPKAPAHTDARFAIPGNVRGLFAVHARYGILNWQQLLLPAERLARTGHPVSRAFAREVDANISRLRAHPETARALGVVRSAIDEGAPLQQIQLSTIISAIRVRGAGDFYQGTSARQFVDAVQQAGGTMTLEDMRDYLPRLQVPLSVTRDNNTYYASGGGGIVAGRVFSMLLQNSLYADADNDGERAHLLVEASRRTFAAAARGGDISMSIEAAEQFMAGYDPDRRSADPAGADTLPDAGSALQNGASLVAVDQYGQVAACGFTMGAPFGTGILAPGTGILLAPADAASASVSQPAAMAVVNLVSNQTFFGAAIGGGAPVALARTVADVRLRGVPVDAAIAAARLYDPARPDTVFHEPGLEPGAVERLRSLGYTLTSAGKLGRINGFFCPDGLPRTPICAFVNDPRGFGLSANADQ